MRYAVTSENINYTLLENSKGANVLIVEDDPVAMEFLEAQIAPSGHTMFSAVNGQEALTFLEKHSNVIDLILMDREMPVMDGLTTVKEIKASPKIRNTPIVMVTGADTTDEMQQGLEAGVFYYLTKPVDEKILHSVLSAALRESQQQQTLESELGKHRTSFNLIESCRFQFSSIEQAKSLSAFIANCFPNPKRALAGIGELLINAVEHGTLGVGYEAKTTLIDNGTWQQEILKRQSLPENANKYVTAIIAKKDDGVYVSIEDMGDGFNWQQYLNIDPARAGDNHGRGIAQARMTSFDKLTFNDKGNKVVAFMGTNTGLDW